MPAPEAYKEFEDRVISIDRVARVVKGGRRFRFRATVVVGDGKGRVGVGVGKGSEVMTSIAKAVAIAKRNLITVETFGTTIPHEVTVRFSGAEVMIKPASEGTGVIAGGAIRSVIEMAGIHDLLSKSLGSSNKINNAYATLAALNQLQARPVGQRSEVRAQKSDGETVASSVEPDLTPEKSVKTETAAVKTEATKKTVAKPKPVAKKAVSRQAAVKPKITTKKPAAKSKDKP